MSAERLAILHTSDLHGGAGGALARIARTLTRDPSLVWLDSGDALRAPNLSFGLTWEDTLRWMSELGCRAMALGNREFELTPGALARKLRAARFPVVCTNMVATADVEMPIRREVLLATAGGRRIRVLGALRDMVCDPLARGVSPFRFREPAEALAEAADEAGSEEVVLLLSHLGEKADLELLRRVPRLDAILGGHTHRNWLHREGHRVAAARPWADGHGMQRLEIDLGRLATARAREAAAT